VQVDRLRKLILLAFALAATACTYNHKTGEARFTPLGPQAHEIIDTVIHDSKECAGPNAECKTVTNHDGYEQAKVKSMTNRELEEYAAKKKQ